MKTKIPAVAEVRRSYRRRPPPTSGRGEKAISKSNCSHVYAMVTLLYRILEYTLKYDAVIRRTWVTAADNNIAFKVVAKPLQIETCLLLKPIKSCHRFFQLYLR